MKLKGSKAIQTKSHAEGPKPRVPYLDLLTKLDNEDCHAIPRRRSGSLPSYPC